MKPMIYPQFIGRLGNNLFQIAACVGYSKKHNVGWGIKKGYVERGFNVNQVDKFFPHLPSCDDTYRTYNEHQPGMDNTWFNYHDIPFHSRGVKIVGFWQSLKYFEHAQEEVRLALNINYVDGYDDYVAIHVRRGDYVQNADSFPPVTEYYIHQAWHQMRCYTGSFKLKQIFISDDIEWCKQTFSNKAAFSEAMYSEGRSEYDDLCLMASCSHNIIANSSFSWWGAFLNQNPNKKVLSPHYQNWFGPTAGVKDPIDIIPNNWIQVKFR